MARKRKQNPTMRRNATRKHRGVTVAPDAPSADGPAPLGDLLARHETSAVDLAEDVTGSLLAELGRVRTPLAAELLLCEVFRMMHRSAPADANGEERVQAETALLAQLIENAEPAGTSDALALLRVCSTLGPDATRAAASEAADRLVADGVKDRPWTRLLGRPNLLRAWHYGDIFGSQASVGALFDYRGREHILMVLIDHGLGGGVKDCWIAEGRRAHGLRDETAAKMSSNEGAFFEDVEAANFAHLLESALAQAPCPQQPDQIDDVAAFDYLTRSRAERVARLADS